MSPTVTDDTLAKVLRAWHAADRRVADLPPAAPAHARAVWAAAELRRLHRALISSSIAPTSAELELQRIAVAAGLTRPD